MFPSDVPRGKHDISSTTFRGPAALKSGSAKSVQKSALFRTTLDFDPEYLRKW